MCSRGGDSLNPLVSFESEAGFSIKVVDIIKLFSANTAFPEILNSVVINIKKIVVVVTSSDHSFGLVIKGSVAFESANVGFTMIFGKFCKKVAEQRVCFRAAAFDITVDEQGSTAVVNKVLPSSLQNVFTVGETRITLSTDKFSKNMEYLDDSLSDDIIAGFTLSTDSVVVASSQSNNGALKAFDGVKFKGSIALNIGEKSGFSEEKPLVVVDLKTNGVISLTNKISFQDMGIKFEAGMTAVKLKLNGIVIYKYGDGEDLQDLELKGSVSVAFPASTLKFQAELKSWKRAFGLSWLNFHRVKVGVTFGASGVVGINFGGSIEFKGDSSSFTASLYASINILSPSKNFLFLSFPKFTMVQLLENVFGIKAEHIPDFIAKSEFSHNTIISYSLGSFDVPDISYDDFSSSGSVKKKLSAGLFVSGGFSFNGYVATADFLFDLSEKKLAMNLLMSPIDLGWITIRGTGKKYFYKFAC